jgi:succinate dehydrogenase/fumarate reductase flavoprotein subunit
MQEQVFDVVVLGTGAAGLTAALRAAADGAGVGLFEKADTVGGTSAWSGGTVWLPNNRHEVERHPPGGSPVHREAARAGRRCWCPLARGTGR